LRVVRRATVSGYLTGEYAAGDAVKTLPLSPDFGDTKRRRTEAPRLLASTQVEVGDDLSGRPGRLIAGIDASIGRLKSRYADVATGTVGDYSAADGSSGTYRAWSSARRAAAAEFITWQVRPANPIRIAVSSRLDHLRDSFRPADAGSGSQAAASHTAVSPRIGANLALPAVSGLATNLYFSLGRVFKAATLDQLFDDRAIPIPVPPFSATISNPLLEPQRGTALEGGLYQTWQLPGLTRLDLSAAAYRERMRDELDFDVGTFRYVNLGRSLHRGIELGATLTGNAKWIVLGSIARQRVVAEGGQFDGRQLKAVPRRIASADFSLPLGLGITAGILANSVGGAFVDDENSRPLAGYTRIDVRLGVPIGRVRATLDVMNAFNRRYDATAFPDPAGSGIDYRYPAAGRLFVVGVESH
jgi:outer membrane receptor protein involved in Fe transport